MHLYMKISQAFGSVPSSSEDVVHSIEATDLVKAADGIVIARSMSASDVDGCRMRTVAKLSCYGSAWMITSVKPTAPEVDLVHRKRQP